MKRKKKIHKTLNEQVVTAHEIRHYTPFQPNFYFTARVGVGIRERKCQEETGKMRGWLHLSWLIHISKATLNREVIQKQDNFSREIKLPPGKMEQTHILVP